MLMGNVPAFTPGGAVYVSVGALVSLVRLTVKMKSPASTRASRMESVAESAVEGAWTARPVLLSAGQAKAIRRARLRALCVGRLPVAALHPARAAAAAR